MNTGNNIGQISINNVAFDHYAKLPLIEFLFVYIYIFVVLKKTLNK